MARQVVGPFAGDSGAGADEEIEFTFDQVKQNIERSATTDVLDLARDQILGVTDEAQRLLLADLADKRDAVLREVA